MGCYKYSFSFNAAHSNRLDNTQVHTHSFVVSAFLKHQENMSYDITEKKLITYLRRYKGKYLNDIFFEIPTIEVIAEEIFKDFDRLIGNKNLIALELSDSPIQLYRIERVE
ncbi:6-carboxytetrahydropterin synthase [Tannockella kyphosi]|uniref:6-carboxytetrahydropterin synthase n=1 Tax=Tannockella kyphosi TaxID=2899121 RepID=UPI0020132218|nr:6-carboxytetrahydropterin synthase [Tannockella kyphosi]